ncbi:RadC family protein [Desulfoplanes sp.]
MKNHPKKPHYLEHRKRLKKRFADHGPNLDDYEILELLLGYAIPRKDTKPQAKVLLERFESLGGVFRARESEIRAIEGIGPSTELFFRVLEECRARISQTPLNQRTVFSNPGDVSDMAIARLGRCEHEEFWTILVDNKNRLQTFEKVSKGTIDQAPVFPREIMTLALEHRSSGIILVHNHPGGDPTPSSQDIQLTNKLQSLAKEMGIRVLDHLVVAEENHYSFMEHGLM